jgi:hypothetical protein
MMHIVGGNYCVASSAMPINVRIKNVALPTLRRFVRRIARLIFARWMSPFHY